MVYSFIAAIFFFWTAAPVLHPLHVSVTEIEYDEKDRALEIMMRIFMDDLEVTLKQKYNNPNFDVLNPGEKSLDEMMGPYLDEHFAVTLDGKSRKARYLGHEQDGEAFIFFIEIGKIGNWKQIGIRNTVLMELYDDQSNLVHVTVGDKVRSLRLTKRNSSGSLSF